jgi:hypothetical protein
MTCWFITMPSEWQERQLALATSAPGPGGNIAELSGSVTDVDFQHKGGLRRTAQRHNGNGDQQTLQDWAGLFRLLLTPP